MAVERTMSIIKPDAVAQNIIGAIYSRFEQSNLKIVAARMLNLSKEQAEGFYAEHKESTFFTELITFMTSGPILVQVLEGDCAVVKNRDLMGVTSPAEASTGTIRADFAKNINENVVHGSDSAESAVREIAYFFTEDQICTVTD